MAVPMKPTQPQGLRGNTNAVRDLVRKHVQDYVSDYEVEDGESQLDRILADIEAANDPRDKNMPLQHKANKYLSGGSFGHIYYDDQRKFLDSLGLRNPSGKQFRDDEVANRYNYYVSKELANMIDEYQKSKPVQFGNDLRPIKR